MTVLRQTLATMIACGALLALVFAIVAGSSSQMIEHTIENSRSILSCFEEGARYVNAVRQATGRLPDSSPFTVSIPRGAGTRECQLFLDKPPFEGETASIFGPAPADAYLLSYWRGEWFEHYASWADRSTLVFEPRSYYLLGSGIADAAAGVLVALSLLAVARLVWRRPTTRCSGRTASGAPLS